MSKNDSSAKCSPGLRNNHDTGRIPSWLRVKTPAGAFAPTTRLLDDLRLSTVCQSAKCPNRNECFGASVATFLILGHECTRDCRFCNVSPATRPEPLQADEPARLAEAAVRLGLSHVVITSVTRDDLADGGAAHFAACIHAVRQRLPRATVEVLTPDFQGDEAALATVLDADPTVFNHNVETCASLYEAVRPQADYAQSLAVLAAAKRMRPDVLVKSGLMVGLGETDADVRGVLADLARVGCDIATVGQYMRPSLDHPPVARWVEPQVFEQYAAWGRELGIRKVFSAPLVRSSYNAGELLGKGCQTSADE